MNCLANISVKPNGIIVRNMNTNALHFTDQETHRERSCSSPSQAETQWKSWESTSPSVLLPDTSNKSKAAWTFKLFFFLIFIWLKNRDPARPESNTASLTVHEYVRNPVLYTANRVKGDFLDQRRQLGESAFLEDL